MKKHNLAFIDLETTGLNPDKHEIIEIGCLVVRQPQIAGGNFEVIDELDLKVKPTHLERAEPEALRINGYNDADWLFAVELPQALSALAGKTDNAIMVAQNVTFDWSFLHRAFETTGVQNRMHFPKIDLISIAFGKLYNDPRIERYNLRELARFFNIENERAHSAMSDIRATFEIYKKLITLP